MIPEFAYLDTVSTQPGPQNAQHGLRLLHRQCMARIRPIGVSQGESHAHHPAQAETEQCDAFDPQHIQCANEVIDQGVEAPRAHGSAPRVAGPVHPDQAMTRTQAWEQAVEHRGIAQHARKHDHRRTRAGVECATFSELLNVQDETEVLHMPAARQPVFTDPESGFVRRCLSPILPGRGIDWVLAFSHVSSPR